MKKKIFLTGATGYLGTKFIELYSSKYEIFGVARTADKNSLDLKDVKKLKRLFLEFSPDFILHLAADVGRDHTTNSEIITTNPAITNNLINLALIKRTPFIFTSTEAVYGGKENKGGYTETDNYKPRNIYGASKIESEKLLIASSLPYLITRGHRHVGISKNFNRPKQFLDALNSLRIGQQVHLDSRKSFNPVLINNACDIFVHYITNDAGRQIILNIGVDKTITFYGLMLNVASTLNIDIDLVKSDGDEKGWPINSSISVQKLHDLQYPSVTYKDLLTKIKTDLE